MRGFFCALFAGILCLESIGGFCRQGYVSEGIREQATHLFHETEEKEVGQLQEDLHLYAQAAVPTPGGYYMEKMKRLPWQWPAPPRS